MSGKFLVNLSFDIVSKNDVETLSAEINKLLKNYAKDNYLFVSQMSVYQQKNPVTGEPLKVNNDGTPKREEFDIVNLVTDVL